MTFEDDLRDSVPDCLDLDRLESDVPSTNDALNGGGFVPNVVSKDKDLKPLPMVSNKRFITISGIIVLCVLMIAAGWFGGQLFMSPKYNVSQVELNVSSRIVNSLGVASSNCSIVSIPFFDGLNVSKRSLIDAECFGSKYLPLVVDNIVNMTNNCTSINLQGSNGLRVLVDKSCVVK